MSRIVKRKLAEIVPDDGNVNRHTLRGAQALTRSVERHGPREAGVLDKNGRVVAGNQRLETYADLGLDEVLVIQADPNVPIFVRYSDLDLSDEENPAREISLALNRIAQLSISLDPVVMAAILAQGIDLSDWFDDLELEGLVNQTDDDEVAGDDRSRTAGAEDRVPEGFVYLAQRVPPQAYVHYRALMAKAPGETDAEQFEHLLATVDPAIWHEDGDTFSEGDEDYSLLDEGEPV